jgi:hypothetical protein
MTCYHQQVEPPSLTADPWPTNQPHAQASGASTPGEGKPAHPRAVTPGFKAKQNAHSMCAQESSLHTYHTENGIWNNQCLNIIYMYYMNIVL